MVIANCASSVLSVSGCGSRVPGCDRSRARVNSSLEMSADKYGDLVVIIRLVTGFLETYCQLCCFPLVCLAVMSCVCCGGVGAVRGTCS